MHNLKQLRVYQHARNNLRMIYMETQSMPAFGDLRNQLQRTALSVVSNIAEGAGSKGNPDTIRFLGYAQASNRELLSQLEILSDIGGLQNTHLLSTVDSCGAMLYKLAKYLSGNK